VQDELLEDIGVLGRREAVARHGRRQAEAGMVDGDAAVAIAQPSDDVAIEKRPGRIAVQEQQRRAFALVQVVDTATGHLDVVVLERIELPGHPRRSGGRAGG